MADPPRMGSADNPIRLDHFQRIIEVGWNTGKFGILEITHPEGVGFKFGAYSPNGVLFDEFTSDDVSFAVMAIVLSEPEGALLYHVDDFFYYIGTVVFPDRVPPDPFAYSTIKASIHPPNRFVEPVDLRTLTDKEFPFHITGWPTDGNWGDPTFDWGTWSDGRPAYLPASSGSDPSAPGYYVNPNWGLGEAYQTTEVERHARKSAWLLDFRKPGDTPETEDRIGDGTVELSIDMPAADEHLSSYTMTLALRMFSPKGVFTAGASTVTVLRPPPSTDPMLPSLTQSRGAAYDQAGIIARIRKSGFLP
jgi:hypothetical protein